jgi:hypothetical protein
MTPAQPGALHVHCGDCAAAVAERAGLPGEIVAWRDSSSVGPSAVDAEAHRRLRADWWDIAAAEIQLPHELPADRAVVLWCGPDPWEQMALVELLAGAPVGAALSLVPLDDGVAVMAAADVAARFDARRDVADLRASMAALWRDFCADDRARLHAWRERLAGEERLPHLPQALLRVLEDRESARTERQVRALISRGVTDLPGLMQGLAEIEAPKHRAWYGDAIVQRLRDQVLAAG